MLCIQDQNPQLLNEHLGIRAGKIYKILFVKSIKNMYA